MAFPAPPPVRPRGLWYLVPTVLVVLAVGLCVTSVVRGFRDARDAALAANAAAPGVDQTLTISDTGGYTIGYSGPFIVSTESQKDDLLDALEVSIEPSDGGTPLEIRRYDGLNDIEDGTQQYVPIGTVRFTEPGDYVLRSSSYGVDRERSALVVSESPFRKLRSGAERAVLLLVVGLALAVLVTVILARTRGRAKKAIRALHPPPGPGWPPPQPQGWGAPPGWPPH